VNQSYKNLEIIVIDDCSTRPVDGICTSLGDNRIISLRNDVNLGVSESRNLGLALSTGDYVSFLDSDDVLSLEKFSSVADLIKKTGGDLIIHSQYRVLSIRDEFLCAEIMPDIQRVRSGNLAENIFRSGDFVQTNTFTVKREIATSQRFEKKYRIWDDSQYVLACAQVAKKIEFLDRPLSVFFDLVDKNRISQKRSVDQHEEMLKYLSHEFFGRAPIYFRALALSDSVFYADPFSAIQFLLAGLRHGVSTKRSLFYFFRCVAGFHRAKTISIAIKAFVKKARGVSNLDEQNALQDLISGRSISGVS
jgi:glycosyltransferase involved in cell wall biosynthesis